MARKYSYRVANVIVAYDLHRQVDIARLYNLWLAEDALTDYWVSSYDEAGMHTGIDVRPRDRRRPVIRLYTTGRGMVVGAVAVDEALEFLDRFVEALEGVEGIWLENTTQE